MATLMTTTIHVSHLAANSAGLLIDPAHSQRIISAYQFNFLSYNFRLALLISS
ncbi:hypothetical protein UUU_29010 [Klebsiella pneumoniae subsp. pneumoniae DSM 30104 = JCM 1662 = NBRC 14940]|nr:hypothetical protein UUU_29010 [Klebsiella pneumoniae subsp. pneumoniae DSM 30104 = JCM 1662 = NBRC 14940]